MKLIVKKTSRLEGAARIPGSKSHSVRALLFATLAEMQTGERSTFMGLLESDDTRAAKSACAALLAGKKKIHTGNSGITTRFILPMLGLRKNADQPVVLDVDTQMRARPMGSLITALQQLGMQIEPVNGDDSGNIKLPVRVSGQLRGGKVAVSGETSQYVSALLMSLPAAEGDSVVTVRNLRERSYMEMMLSWLDFYGIRYEHNPSRDEEGELDEFKITGGQTYVAKDRNIPGDFSSASYLLAASALIPGEVRLQGLDMNDSQGDKAMVQILQNMGANIRIEKSAIGDEIVVRGIEKIRGTKPELEINCNLIPDMLPTLAVFATQIPERTHIFNVAHARIKETDRIHSMAEGLRAMGAGVQEMEDGLIVNKGSLHGARVKGYEDHRTIMALAIAGMLADGTDDGDGSNDGETVIDTAEGISKTFPNFVQLMQSLGADIQVQQDHIVLMGFKHSGKTTLGRGLAEVFDREFIDLDDKIEELHCGSNGERQTCREIMQSRGAEYFRNLEAKALAAVLQAAPSVVALGGGAPMLPENQKLLRSELCMHVHAGIDELIERIERHGWPAFVDKEDPRGALRKIWAEREPVYKKLAKVTVQSQPDASGTLEAAKAALASHLPVNFIIGDPLDHTYTPRLHNAAYAELGVNFLMGKNPCESVDEYVAKIREIPVHLTVVTMPHKQTIMQYIDEIDEQAKAVGAVNTVINREGRLTGYNTDVDGIAYVLGEELGSRKIEGQKVLLLGAGGAAKAAAYFVNREGGNLYCLNRDRKKAEALTTQFGGQAIDANHLSEHEFAVVINATPLGMGQHVGVSPLAADDLRGSEAIFDMIYNPMQTELLKIAADKGCKTVSGLDMFVAQGLRQIELLTGEALDPQYVIQKLFPQN